jgi:hypothetical protein
MLQSHIFQCSWLQTAPNIKPLGELKRYSHSLQDTLDTPKHIFKSPWALQMYTSSLFKKGAKATTLDNCVLMKWQTFKTAYFLKTVIQHMYIT